MAVLGSITFKTASTAIGENNSEYEDTTFELKDVFTHSIKVYLLVISTGKERLFYITDKASFRHFWNPSDTRLGWIPFSNKVSAAFKRAPAKTTTEVVPSPASTSWAFEIYTSILAVGWTTSIFWRIVAPSLVIRVYPLPSLIILSIPLGPRLVLIQSATALAAWMFVERTSLDF